MPIALNNRVDPEGDHMSKTHKIKDLQKQWSARTLLAVSLAASLAAFGCTTNHNLGNGTPTRSGPEVRSAPTSGVTSGTEQSTPARAVGQSGSACESAADDQFFDQLASGRGGSQRRG